MPEHSRGNTGRVRGCDEGPALTPDQARVLECLRCTPWCPVSVRLRVRQRERVAEFRGERLWRVADNWQAAALVRSVRRECGDDGAATALQRRPQSLFVAVAGVARGEEMKRGAVVPDVDWLPRPLGGDIRFDPPYL